MQIFPKQMQELVAAFSKLPTIGEKSATRLAYHLVVHEPELARSMSQALLKAADDIKLCKHCFFLTDSDVCPICADKTRDPSLLCVVEKPADVVSVERTGEYKGYYHVLHGLWAPLRGQGTESMRLKELVARCEGGTIREVIIATAATVEGDATALYIARLLQDMHVRVSRPAQGVPKGGELEYLDDVTLTRAFAGRVAVGESHF